MERTDGHVLDNAGSTDACVVVRAPAKINLFLAVRGTRSDGFHELVSVMQSIGVHDELVVAVTGPPGQGHHPAARRRMRVDLVGTPVDGVAAPQHNLVLKAARLLGESAGVFEVGDRTADPGVEVPRTVVELRKAIPVAAGMAGGSADAAAALVALNQLWGCDLERDALEALGGALGSDVPFCLVGGTALATGRGTAVAQVLCRGTFHWVVCSAHEPLPTERVYAAWDERCRPGTAAPDAVLAALRNGDAEALGAALHNELEPAAFHLRPELAEHRAALLEAGALGVVLSGSGPTLLALAGSRAQAEGIAAAVPGRFARTLVAHSPAGGPETRPC